MYIQAVTVMQAFQAIQSYQPINMWREGQMNAPVCRSNDDADKSAASQAALSASEDLSVSQSAVATYLMDRAYTSLKETSKIHFCSRRQGH